LVSAERGDPQFEKRKSDQWGELREITKVWGAEAVVQSKVWGQTPSKKSFSLEKERHLGAA